MIKKNATSNLRLFSVPHLKYLHQCKSDLKICIKITHSLEIQDFSELFGLKKFS